MAQVTVEGTAIDLQRDGTFTFSRYVPIGMTSARIEAFDEWGNRSERTIMITRIVTALIKKIQRSLTQLGYGPGPVDGTLGDRTRSAIRSFQRDSGLPVDGDGTESLLARLEDAVSRKAETLPPSIAKAQPREDTVPPRIDLPGHLTASGDSIRIRGRVTDDSRIVAVVVSGKSVAFGSDGSFSVDRYVPSSGDMVDVEAVDEWNNRSKHSIKITRAITQVTDTISFARLDPTTINVHPNQYALALIIGVEDYERAPKAVFANRDAQVFSDYARRALGVPQSNIKALINDQADLSDLRVATKQWLRGRIQAGLSDVYVFFAGHGLASPDGEDLYLLPRDGVPSLLEDTALLRSELFEVISAAKPRSVTLFLDTCYSGLSRGEEMLMASARPIVISPKNQSIPIGFTVFSAASGQQISSGLDEAEHGLFSYFLMKGMEGPADANGDRRITAGELHTYVLGHVQQQAIRLGREQTPGMVGDAERVLVRW